MKEPRPQTLSDGAKIAACWVVACVLTVCFLQISGAADITPGYTFTPGEKNITDVKLNAATAGTVGTAFFTGKSAGTAVNADTLLFYSASGATFYKTTVQTFFNNVPQLTTLGALNSTGDFAVNTSKFTVGATDGAVAWLGPLTASSNAVFSLSKNAVGVGITNTSAGASAVALSVDGSAGTPGNALKVYGGATVSGVSAFSNNVTFYASASISSQLTVSQSALLNGNVNLGSDTSDTTTINGVLAGTLYGAPVVGLTNATPLTTDKFLFQASGDSSKLRIGTLPTLLNTYTTNASVTDGKPIDVAHGLGGVPDSVTVFLQCTNAERGYDVGDYVLANSVLNASWRPVLSGGANATNAFVLVYDSANLNMFSKTNAGAGIGTVTALTNWNVRIVAVKKP